MITTYHYFRSNRDFWNQRVAIQQKQKQTPDLVLDLPASEAGAKPKPRPRGKTSDSSSNSSNSGDENLAGADQFANSNKNTLRKSNSKEENENNSSPGSSLNNPNAKKIPPVQARLQRKSPPREWWKTCFKSDKNLKKPSQWFILMNIDGVKWQMCVKNDF